MDQAMTYFDGRAGNWYSICENPDAEDPVWSTPQYIGFGCSLNKPTVMSTGEWVLPVSLWPRSKMDILLERGWTANPLREAHHELDSVRGAHAFVSTDQGKTWEDRGFVQYPSPSFDEHQFIELQDGRWWMTARTGLGIYQSFSSDKGYSWSAPELYSKHVNSRHFIRRLDSGALLLVRHGMPDKKLKKRSHLRAFCPLMKVKHGMEICCLMIGLGFHIQPVFRVQMDIYTFHMIISVHSWARSIWPSSPKMMS